MADSCPILSLPDDVSLQIFRLLPLLHRISCQSVCATWRILLRHPSLYDTIDLTEAPDLSSLQIQRLMSLSLSSPPFPGSFTYGLRHLNLTGAWKLDLRNLIPSLRFCFQLETLKVIGGRFGRPLVTAEVLSELVYLYSVELKYGNRNLSEERDENWSNARPLLLSSSAGSSIEEDFVLAGGNVVSDVEEDISDVTSQNVGGLGQMIPMEYFGPLDSFTEKRQKSNNLRFRNNNRPFISPSIELDLEVDWSTEEDKGETTSQLSGHEWSTLFSVLNCEIPSIKIRALYIELFFVEQTWPSLLSSLEKNDNLEELYLVFLHCNVLHLGMMLENLVDSLEGNSLLQVLQIKYAEFQSPLHLRPLKRLMTTQNSSIRRLELVKCDFPLGGEMGLEEIISENFFLEELVLNTGTKVSSLASALARNTRLKFFQSHGMTENDVVALSEALHKNKTLLELDLKQLVVTQKGFMAIASALRNNDSLTSLHLNYGQVDYFSPTEGIVEGIEAIVEAVKERGGMKFLGLSVPDTFWVTSSKAPFFSLPRRFYEPSLVQLSRGPCPLVETLHMTSPWEEWQAGDGSAWRLWFGLSQGRDSSFGENVEALSRRREMPQKGVILQLLHDTGEEEETWETHTWVPELLRHIPRKQSFYSRLVDYLLLLFFPFVHIWQEVDSTYHLDFSNYIFLDWFFIAPLAFFKTIGLILAVLTLYLITYTQTLFLRARYGVSLCLHRIFGRWVPFSVIPTEPLRTPEGHRLLRNIV